MKFFKYMNICMTSDRIIPRMFPNHTTFSNANIKA